MLLIFLWVFELKIRVDCDELTSLFELVVDFWFEEMAECHMKESHRSYHFKHVYFFLKLDACLLHSKLLPVLSQADQSSMQNFFLTELSNVSVLDW